MVDIVTRAGKGSPLTNNEVDANFTNLAEVSGITGEPMGHEDRTTSTISFNASTRTFTIAPVNTSFTVWCKGKKVVVSSAQTVTIPNTSGMHSIYYDANGTLSSKLGYFTFSEEAPTAYVYWNATTGAAPYFGDERHGVVLDWQTHEYLHRTRGAALASGFGASGYTLGGNGTSNAHAQLTLEGGTFFDEDMKIIVTATNTPTAGTWEQDLLSPARIPVLYLSGTGWVIDAPTDYPLKQGTARPQYNALSGGVWSTADVANNKYATSWILATNNLTYPVIAIIGQAESDLQSAAEAVDFTSLQLPGFPSVEFRPLYRLVFQCADSFSNAVKASLVSITDIRSIAAAGVAASLITDHGNLSGLSDDDHPQYLSVDTVRGTLTAAVKASFLPSQAGNAGKFLTTDATSTSWAALTSGNITTALGFTPYNATNPAGYITGITSGNVTTALGFTPYNATNPSGFVTAAGARGAISVTGAGSYDSATGVINIVGGVTSFNTRTGAITLSSADVTTALGFTPYNNTNPNGYLTGITSTQVTTALGYTPYNSSNPSGYITGITSGMVTTALGFTPYNNSNPSGYITSSALSGYLTSASAASTYAPLTGTGASGTWGISITGNAATVTNGLYKVGTNAIPAAVVLNTTADNWMWQWASSGINDWYLGPTTANFGIGGSRLAISSSGSSPAAELSIERGTTKLLEILQANLLYKSNVVLHAGNYNSYALPLSGGTLSGTLRFGDSTNGIYLSGGRLNIRSESTDNVAEYASYGLYLPKTGQTAGLYVQSPIEARGGLRIGSGAENGTITVGADTSATANRLVQRDASGHITGNYILGSYFNASAGNSENPTIGQVWTQSTGDNYLRKSTPAHFISQLGLITTSNYSSYALPLSGGTMTGQLNIRTGDPTIVFQDTNHRSAMVHVNSNVFYVLRGTGTDSTSYATYNGYWPMELNLENNNASFGGSITSVGNTVLHAGNYTNYAAAASHSHNYIPINPDGDGSAWSYADENPTINGVSIGGGQRFGADGSSYEGFLQAKIVNAYNGFVNSANGYYIGNYDFGANSNTFSTTRIIDGSGNITAAQVQSSGNSGFKNDVYYSSVRNPIWYFGNATAYGISYFQGSAGRDSIDTITLHPNGSTSATGATFATNSNNAFVNNNVVLNASNYTSYSPSLGGSGASGTWGISITGSASSATATYRAVIEDTRAGLRSPNAYDDYRAHFEFTDQIVGGDWHTAFTMQGWHDGYSAWQIIGPASTSAHENFYLRSGINTSWNSVRTILHSGNYSNYAVPQSDVAENGASKVLRTASNGYLSVRNWIDIAGAGIFSSTTNSAHFLANDGTYGSWKVLGTRNGWAGLEFGSLNNGPVSLMVYTSSNETGFHNQNYGWQFRWNDGALYCHKNSYGGGTSARVLDASNYTSYSPSLGGSGASGTWGISISGNSATVGSKASSTFHQRVHFGTQDSLSGGYYKVRILAATSWMLSFVVRIYQGYESYDIRISGYNYGPYYWYQPSASLIDSTSAAIDVRFGYDSAYNLWVAFPASNYTGLDVVNIVNGYTQFDGNYADQFAIQYESSLSGSVQTTQTTYRPLKSNENAVSATTASNLQGYGPNQTGGANTIVQRDGNGYIQNSYFYTSGGGTERNGSGLGYFAGFNSSDYYIRSWTAGAAAAAIQTAASGSWGITAAKATRANGNMYIDDNYGNTVVGVYSSYRYQGVFAMGDSYKLAADGTSLGTLYGMAWSHPNTGGAAGNLTDHGLLIINNGGFRCAISNSIVASGNITAYSDERLKTNWRDMPEDYVTRLAEVKVGIYDRIDEKEMAQVGVSAQSFQKLLPQAIMTAKDEMQTLSVNYGSAALASAVELAKRVVDQEKRIAHLESLISKLIGD